MADIDIIGLISTIMLVVSGFFIFFGVPLLVFLLKNKLSFWPRQKWRTIIYEAEISEFPIYEEQPFLDDDGKQVYDAKGKPVTNKKKVAVEKRLNILSEKPELDTLCWRIKEGAIPWLWVDRGMLKGFKLDESFLAYCAPINEKNQKAIRVAHLTKGVWEGASFYPLGRVEMTNLDERHTIFTHQIDKETVDKSISAMSKTAWVDFQKNRNRKDEDGMSKLLQMMAPVFIVVIVLVAIIFTLDYANKSQDKSTAIWTQNAKACSLGYTYMEEQPQTNTTQQQTPSGIKLPFG